MHFRLGDEVIVISGNKVGGVKPRGKILAIDRKLGKVTVEGVNRVYKHVRRSQRNPQGGRLQKEMPIDVSNVQHIDPKLGKPTRVGVRILADGSKELYAKKSGSRIRELSPPRPARAKLAIAQAAR